MTLESLEDRLLVSGVVELVRSFETWDGGIIRSTDVAGITYHSPSGHLYLADSEINEISSIFNGDNIFAVSTLGDQVFREISSGNNEPTGITYSEFDGFFYVTNDNAKRVYRYDSSLDDPLTSIVTTNDVSSAQDPEGIASNPLNGDLYVVDGSNGGRQVLVYDADLQFQYKFSVAGRLQDAEGIAFDPQSNHLFVVSEPDQTIAEYTLTGDLVNDYALDGLSPVPMAPQGLTFGPTSDPNDDPGATAIYIADGMVDNSADGRIYEGLLNSQGGNEPPSGTQNPQSTAGLFKPASSTFFLTDANEPGPAESTFRYGPLGVSWLPIVDDWNGDGSDTVGLHDPLTGRFFLKNDNAAGPADSVFTFGPVGTEWTPVSGDWDGDGSADVGLYSATAGEFHLRNAGTAELVFGFGPVGNDRIPVTGDWDGNGSVTVGLYDQQAGLFLLKNSNTSGGADVVFRYGPKNVNWQPAIGDWNSDGIETAGLFDSEAGNFFLRNSHTPGYADLTFRYGPKESGWTPLAGAWIATTNPIVPPAS